MVWPRERSDQPGFNLNRPHGFPDLDLHVCPEQPAMVLGRKHQDENFDLRIANDKIQDGIDDQECTMSTWPMTEFSTILEKEGWKHDTLEEALSCEIAALRRDQINEKDHVYGFVRRSMQSVETLVKEQLSEVRLRIDSEIDKRVITCERLEKQIAEVSDNVGNEMKDRIVGDNETMRLALEGRHVFEKEMRRQQANNDQIQHTLTEMSKSIDKQRVILSEQSEMHLKDVISKMEGLSVMHFQKKRECEKSKGVISRQIQDLQGLRGLQDRIDELQQLGHIIRENQVQDFQILEQEIAKHESIHKVLGDAVGEISLRSQSLDTGSVGIKERLRQHEHQEQTNAQVSKMTELYALASKLEAQVRAVQAETEALKTKIAGSHLQYDEDRVNVRSDLSELTRQVSDTVSAEVSELFEQFMKSVNVVINVEASARQEQLKAHKEEYVLSLQKEAEARSLHFTDLYKVLNTHQKHVEMCESEREKRTHQHNAEQNERLSELAQMLAQTCAEQLEQCRTLEELQERLKCLHQSLEREQRDRRAAVECRKALLEEESAICSSNVARDELSTATSELKAMESLVHQHRAEQYFQLQSLKENLNAVEEHTTEIVSAQSQGLLSKIEEVATVFRRNLDEEIQLRNDHITSLRDEVRIHKQNTLDALAQEGTERKNEVHNLQVRVNEFRDKGDIVKAEMEDIKRHVWDGTEMNTHDIRTDDAWPNRSKACHYNPSRREVPSHQHTERTKGFQSKAKANWRPQYN